MKGFSIVTNNKNRKHYFLSILIACISMQLYAMQPENRLVVYTPKTPRIVPQISSETESIHKKRRTETGSATATQAFNGQNIQKLSDIYTQSVSFSHEPIRKASRIEMSASAAALTEEQIIKKRSVVQAQPSLSAQSSTCKKHRIETGSSAAASSFLSSSEDSDIKKISDIYIIKKSRHNPWIEKYPLHQAVQNGDLAKVYRLIAMYGDDIVHVKNDEGKTPLEVGLALAPSWRHEISGRLSAAVDNDVDMSRLSISPKKNIDDCLNVLSNHGACINIDDDSVSDGFYYDSDDDLGYNGSLGSRLASSYAFFPSNFFPHTNKDLNVNDSFLANQTVSTMFDFFRPPAKYLGRPGGEEKEAAYQERLAEAYFQEHHVDIDAKGQTGKTLLQTSICYSYPRCIEFCLRHNARFDNVDNNGNTLLHDAAQKGSLEIVELLLQQCDQAVLNAVNNDGNTALHYAAQKGYLQVVELLLQQCDQSVLDAVNNDGNTASDLTSNLAIKRLIAENLDAFQSNFK